MILEKDFKFNIVGTNLTDLESRIDFAQKAKDDSVFGDGIDDTW